MVSFFPSFNIIAQIGPFTIRWYAVCILFGAVLAYLLGQKRFKELNYASTILSDYFVGVLVIGILGARIWYVALMWNELYAADPASSLYIWQGGLAIQGGLFAGLAYSLWFFKQKDIPFLVAADAIMPGVLVAQACGRWGNFFNQEAHGTAVTRAFLESLKLPAFIIDHMNIGGTYYHPTFLYESLGNLLVFLIIILVVRHFQKNNGEQFFSYFIGYGTVRYFVESLRTDSLMIGPLRMAQVISVLFVIGGLAGFVYVRKHGTPCAFKHHAG